MRERTCWRGVCHGQGIRLSTQPAYLSQGQDVTNKTIFSALRTLSVQEDQQQPAVLLSLVPVDTVASWTGSCVSEDCCQLVHVDIQLRAITDDILCRTPLREFAVNQPCGQTRVTTSGSLVCLFFPLTKWVDGRSLLHAIVLGDEVGIQNLRT